MSTESRMDQEMRQELQRIVNSLAEPVVQELLMNSPDLESRLRATGYWITRIDKESIRETRRIAMQTLSGDAHDA